MTALNGAFVVEEAHGRTRNNILHQNNMDTYFIVGSSRARVRVEVRYNISAGYLIYICPEPKQPFKKDNNIAFQSY